MKYYITPPNQLTFLRILVTPLFVYLLFSPDPVSRQLSIIVFLVALLTDWYDGWVARRWGYVTRWGSFLDPLADKIVTSSAFISFIYLDLVPPWTVWIIVFRDIVITLLRSYSEYKGKPFDTSKMAKTKTFLQFTVLFYILLLYVGQGVTLLQPYHALIGTMLNPTLLYFLMVCIAIITVWTGTVYTIDNRRTLQELYAVTNRVTES
ncbi:MAG TPA: CDP-diacylglycerol--glycerol-3-phosphate 3-phosphatidyltransferase [Bacteroidota bacterium]|nr:CDP-diacylglycerol--glycerol-3-phosphate 3-phosphatidyltransferase [Bacteroidota bacterium]